MQRGQQKLSYSGVVLISLLWLVMFIMLFFSIGQVVNWLDYLYIISYIKLSVTPIKYVPQVSFAWYVATVEWGLVLFGPGDIFGVCWIPDHECVKWLSTKTGMQARHKNILPSALLLLRNNFPLIMEFPALHIATLLLLIILDSFVFNSLILQNVFY